MRDIVNLKIQLNMHYTIVIRKFMVQIMDQWVQPLQCVALVGPSGAGKTTLVDLIPRFYDIDKGSIEIDGYNIKDLALDSLREQIGFVSQQSVLFNDTIYNNIALGVEDISLDEVEAAAKLANAHDFIVKLDKGYQSNIGDQGNKLSGGQKQRLTIARAILRLSLIHI